MPRVLVLHTVCATLDKGEFEPALRLMRAQKVDMNLTHDHNPAAFLQTRSSTEQLGIYRNLAYVPVHAAVLSCTALPTLVRQASPHLLSLLISALRPDDVTVSTYPNAPPPSSSALVPKAAPIVGGATVRKVVSDLPAFRVFFWFFFLSGSDMPHVLWQGRCGVRCDAGGSGGGGQHQAASLQGRSATALQPNQDTQQNQDWLSSPLTGMLCCGMRCTRSLPATDLALALARPTSPSTQVLTFVRRDPPQVEAAVRSLQAQEQSVQARTPRLLSLSISISSCAAPVIART
eukprot:3114262-Rhodomonas_salina.2